MSNVNDQAPLKPPPDSAGATPPPPSPRASGIPSVNARGGRTRSAGLRIFVVGMALLVLVVGSLVMYRNHAAAQRAEEARLKQERAEQNRPAAVNRRSFADVALPAAPKPPTPAKQDPDCIESEILLGNDGQPVLSVSGQPMRICKDGRIFVRKQPPKPVPPIALAPKAAPKPAPAKGPSRYGGAVLLPAIDDVTDAVEKAAGKGARGQQPGPTPAQGLTGRNDAGAMTQVAYSPGGGSADGTSQDARPLMLSQAGDYGRRGGAARAQEPAGTGQGQPPARQLESLGGNLVPSETPRVSATMLGDRNMVLPRGRTIDCALGVRVVTEVSGMAECIVSSNVYSDNGKVLLIERGSQASGEYRANMTLGQRRLFLLWNRIKTPNGVVIDLNSPASDALGTSGLGGYIDQRWGDRVGAALLVSLVQDALSYGIERERYRSRESGSGGNVYYNNQPGWAYGTTERTSERVVEEILSATLQIRPTLYKNQGDRAAIYVARDLDFSPVYELQPR